MITPRAPGSTIPGTSPIGTIVAEGDHRIDLLLSQSSPTDGSKTNHVRIRFDRDGRGRGIVPREGNYDIEWIAVHEYRPGLTEEVTVGRNLESVQLRRGIEPNVVRLPPRTGLIELARKYLDSK